MDQENVETQRPEPIKLTFEITVDVDPFWIQYLTQYVDIFAQSRAGYWLHGI